MTRSDLQVELNLDGTGVAEIETGIGFLDHMLCALAKHSQFDLKMKCVVSPSSDFILIYLREIFMLTITTQPKTAVLHLGGCPSI